MAENHATDSGAALIQARIDRIAEQKDSFERARSRAQQLFLDGDSSAAIKEYENIQGNNAWRRLPAFSGIREERSRAEERVEADRMLGEELREAMRQGRASEVGVIAARLGIDVLPMYVTTTPSGGTVTMNGEVLGQAPLFIEDLSLAARMDVDVSITMNGFKPARVSAVNAVGGWQLAVTLQRHATQVVRLPEPVTSRPVVLDNKMWLVGNRQAFAVSSQGDIVNYSLDRGSAAPLEN